MHAYCLPTIDERRRSCAPTVHTRLNVSAAEHDYDSDSAFTARHAVDRQRGAALARSNSVRVASATIRSMVNDQRFASAIRARLGRCERV
jgi:hypothetical protein